MALILTYVFGVGVAIDGLTVPPGTAVPARIGRDAQGKRRLETAQTLVIQQRVVPEGFTLPADDLLTASDPLGQLVVHTVQGAFNLYIKVAFYAAIFFRFRLRFISFMPLLHRGCTVTNVPMCGRCWC